MSEYRAPTEDQVKEAMRRITRTQLRRAFFEGIENPLWVKPLADAGAFSSPPEPVESGDGYVREDYWPEGVYLAKVAENSPQDVVDVLLSLQGSRNSWVRRLTFDVGARISPEFSAQLRPLIESWASTGFGWRTDPRDVVSMAINLIVGGERENGLWLADLAFNIAGEAGRSAILDDYWFAEQLPRLTAVLDVQSLGVALSWLVSYERAQDRLNEGSDLSYLSRESIESNDDDFPEVEHALIDAVRDLAVRSMSVDPESTRDVLLNSEMVLARKIALFSASQALRLSVEGRLAPPNLLAVASSLLVDKGSREDPCRIEFAQLAQAVSGARGAPVEELSQAFALGPAVDADKLRRWIGEDTDDESEINDLVNDYVDRWRHRWLSSIGIEALPAQLQTDLQALDARFGVLEDPLAPIRRVTSWTGPNSPLGSDEMAAMSPSELVGHLETWHSPEDTWGPVPSHEGQGRELTALLTTNPEAVSGVPDLVRRLRPIYLRAILRGWEAALSAGLTLDWESVADTVEAVLVHEDASPFPAEGGRWDDDPDFRPAKRAAVGLLEDLVKVRPEPTVPAPTMRRLAGLLIDTAADEAAWEEYDSADPGEMDPLTISLNWQWPSRLRGLVNLLCRPDGSEWREAARSALDTELEREDSNGAAYAVIGEGAGRLLDGDPDWLDPRVPQLFGTEDGITVPQQIALSAALALYRYHGRLHKLLTGPMQGALRLEGPMTAGWQARSDPLQRIGEWVVSAEIRGDTDAHDPLERAFFSLAPAEIRGAAMGHIAWAFMHAEAVDDDIRDRFAAMWDRRIAHVREHPEDGPELNGFHWVVRCRKFDTTWWLPRLEEALELNPGLVTEPHSIGKDLALAAVEHPATALDVLQLLLDGRDDAGFAVYDLTRNAVPFVIARAIESGDEALAARAIAYMNQLGERGNLALDAQVQQVLAGASSAEVVQDRS